MPKSKDLFQPSDKDLTEIERGVFQDKIPMMDDVEVLPHGGQVCDMLVDDGKKWDEIPLSIDDLEEVMHNPGHAYIMGMKFMGVSGFRASIAGLSDADKDVKYDFAYAFIDNTFTSPTVRKRLLEDLLSNLLTTGRPLSSCISLAKDIQSTYSMKLNQKRILGNVFYEYANKGEHDAIKLLQDEFGIQFKDTDKARQSVNSLLSSAKYTEAEKLRDRFGLTLSSKGKAYEWGFASGLKKVIDCAQTSEEIAELRSTIKRLFPKESKTLIPVLQAYVAKFIYTEQFDRAKAITDEWSDINFSHIIRERIMTRFLSNMDNFKIYEENLGYTYYELAKSKRFKKSVLIRMQKYMPKCNFPDDFLELSEMFINKYDIDPSKMPEYYERVEKAFKVLVERGEYQYALRFEELYGGKLQIKDTVEYELAKRNV